MSLVLKTPCKVNLLLNILCRREDGFHELETIIQPVPLYDELRIEKDGNGIELTCSDARLPVGEDNLVYRAAAAYLGAIEQGGVRIHLQKNLPIAAGIGAGSGNAAFTLRGLNELFDYPLDGGQLQIMAAALGSDVPFYLQDAPALGSGRGELVESLEPFPVLMGKGLLLIYPGFGVSTQWAYQELEGMPEAYGESGQMELMVQNLRSGELNGFYNSLEEPVFQKYVILPVLKQFLLDEGALVALMSGSGSTTFAITGDRAAAEVLRVKYHERFGQGGWSASVEL
mgnify:FL=1